MMSARTVASVDQNKTFLNIFSDWVNESNLLCLVFALLCTLQFNQVSWLWFALTQRCRFDALWVIWQWKAGWWENRRLLHLQTEGLNAGGIRVHLLCVCWNEAIQKQEQSKTSYVLKVTKKKFNESNQFIVLSMVTVGQFSPAVSLSRGYVRSRGRVKIRGGWWFRGPGWVSGRGNRDGGHPASHRGWECRWTACLSLQCLTAANRGSQRTICRLLRKATGQEYDNDQLSLVTWLLSKNSSSIITVTWLS